MILPVDFITKETLKDDIGKFTASGRRENLNDIR